MTQAEINKLHKSISTDFKIIARKTELWGLLYCYEILHDIKRLMLFQYLESVSLILNDFSNIPLRVKKYRIGYTNRSRDDRPGGIDWEDGEGQNLSVVLIYSPNYHALTPEAKNIFQRDHLKIPWSPTYVDTNFPHLPNVLTKMYTHEGGGIDRIDFN